MTDTAVFVHGFASTAASWAPVTRHLDHERYRPLALDLRGHGQNAALRPITFALCVSDLLAASPKRFTLVGYSLGARLALQVALAAPGRVTRLVLISSTAGIDDDEARAARLRADEALAASIETAPIAEFADSWLAGPLFAADPSQVNAAARQQIERNDPRSLACALRALSVGAMAPLWDRLPDLSMPVTVAAGGLDLRYVAFADRIAAAVADSEKVIVRGAGHALPRLAPQAVAELIMNAR